MKTTNYYDTFIEVAEDCPVSVAEVPPKRGERKTVANLQFDLLEQQPYELTSDDVVFQVYAIRNDIGRKDAARAREQFFSKGQPCLRASPLAKRYGWGIHSDSKGRVAIHAVESVEYARLVRDEDLKHLKAMRSSRK